MEAALPATQACARCARVVPIQNLVYDASASLICASCDADGELESVARSSVTRVIVAPPLLGLIGSIGLCLPFLNLFVPAVLGIGAAVAAVSAIRLGATGAANEGVTESTKALLFVSGAVGGLWGLGLVGVNALAWLGLALS